MHSAQIFFPTDSLNKSGYILGFNTRGFSFTVIHIDDRPIEQIEATINSWNKQDQIQSLCGAKFQILGFNGPSQKSETRDTWLQMSNLTIESLMICGYKYSPKCTIILYDRLHKNQILKYSEQTINAINPLVAFNRPISELHAIKDQDEHELSYALQHINFRSTILRHYFQNDIKQSDNMYLLYLKINISQLLLKIFAFHQQVFKYFLSLMDYEIFGRSLNEMHFLRNTTKQVKLKYNMMNQWNDHARLLLSEHQPLHTKNILDAYHKLFAGMLYMFMDIVLGILSLLVLYYNVSQLREFIHKYGSNIHIEVLSKEIEWLMGFPAGLKTNRPLNIVLGQMILYIILFWNEITTIITPYETYLLRTMLIFGLFGLTFEIALAMDIISLCTIHVYYIYRSLAFVYRHILHVSLQFYRVTKNRFIHVITHKMDERIFSWEQKILAMFLCFFLIMVLPTVSLYYFWFLLNVIFIYLSKVILLSLSKIVTRFPLFQLYQYYFGESIEKEIELECGEQIHLKPKKLPLTKVIQLEKLFRINSSIKVGDLIKSVFSGTDLTTQRKSQRQSTSKFQNFEWVYKL